MSSNLGKRKDNEEEKEQSQHSKRKLQGPTLTGWVVEPEKQKDDASSSSSITPLSLFAETDEIKDRDSIFIAHAAHVSSHRELLKMQTMIRNGLRGSMATRYLALGKPAHVMCAARYVGIKPGKKGFNQKTKSDTDLSSTSNEGDTSNNKNVKDDGNYNVEDDFEIQRVSDDDGERFGGDRVLKIINQSGALDVGVCVTRWFGGTLLGPVRFTHIENVTQSALKKLHQLEKETELEEMKSKLVSLDSEIDSLTSLIKQEENPNNKTDTQSNNMKKISEENVGKIEEEEGTAEEEDVYKDLKMETGARLIKAREKRISFLKNRLTRLQQAKNTADP